MRCRSWIIVLGLIASIGVGGCRKSHTFNTDPIPPIPEHPTYYPMVGQTYLPPVLEGLSFGVATEEDFLARFDADNLSVIHHVSTYFGGDTDEVWETRGANRGYPYNELVVSRLIQEHEAVGEFYADLEVVILRFARNEEGRGPVLAEVEIAQPMTASPSICDPARGLLDEPGAMEPCTNRFPYQPRVTDHSFVVCGGSPDGRRELTVRCVEPASGEGTRRIFYTMGLPREYRLPGYE